MEKAIYASKGDAWQTEATDRTATDIEQIKYWKVTDTP